MSRRRRDTSHLKSATSADYTEAFGHITQMEAAVIWRMLDWRGVTADDVPELLWPMHTVDLLRKARVFCSSAPGQTHVDTRSFMGEINYQIVIRNDDLPTPMLPPDVLIVQPQTTHPKWDAFFAALTELSQIRADHNKLRQVVRYFNKEGVTYGCARFNAPWLMTILPKTHKIHEVTGELYRTHVFPQDITDALRASADTITRGLLADPVNTHGPDKASIRLQMGRANVTGDYHDLAIM